MSKVPKEDVMSHVAGYSVTIDVTCRDLQEKCKAVKQKESLGQFLNVWIHSVLFVLLFQLINWPTMM